MPKERVTLRTHRGTFTVDATVHGPLALHAEMFGVQLWRISHIASGSAVFTTPSFRTARRAIRRLAAEVDWSGIEWRDGGLVLPSDYNERLVQVKRIIREEASHATTP